MQRLLIRFIMSCSSVLFALMISACIVNTGFAATNTRLQPTSPSASVIKYNSHWSGYVLGSGSGNGFKSVQGSWNTQCTGSAAPASASQQVSTWVGLGGYYGLGLVQTGTEIDDAGNYHLFLEVINANGVDQIKQYVPNASATGFGCGQHIQAVVYYHPAGCSGGFTTSIVNSSNNTSLASGCIFSNSDIQSAEWIDERPYCQTDFATLADFNWTGWSNVLAQANYSGAAWVNPNAYYNINIIMAVGHTPSTMAATDGNSVNSDNTFTDRWYNSGPATTGSCGYHTQCLC
ncbi:MAG TPA: G1 family glutamic endopeptidase [Ktedonobacteraceae bacterium]